MVRSEVKKAPTKQKFTSIRLDLWTLLPCAGNTHFSGVFLGYLKKETNKNPGTWWPMFRLDPHLLNGACLFKPTLGKWGKYIECLGCVFYISWMNLTDSFCWIRSIIYYIDLGWFGAFYVVVSSWAVRLETRTDQKTEKVEAILPKGGGMVFGGDLPWYNIKIHPKKQIQVIKIE